jgi:site-specific DNA-cytosine methylase
MKTLCEFFGGVGMARLGFGSGWECVVANAISPAKRAAYVANFGRGNFLCRAVEDVKIADLPPGRVDCCWMSPPCVGHSEAGNKLGFDERESRAFWPAWALIEALDAQNRAPLTAAFENVVGIKPENLRAVQRIHLHPWFAGVVMLTAWPRWVPREQETASPRHNFAWAVWSAAPQEGDPWLRFAGKAP